MTRAYKGRPRHIVGKCGPKCRICVRKSKPTVDNNHELGEVLLVVELRVDENGVAEEAAEVSGLVPPDHVVVHVHVAEILHHLNLNRVWNGLKMGVR